MGSIKNEMVNRVALAIAKASGINDWFKAADEYEEEARAAIEAMREPTSDMANAGRWQPIETAPKDRWFLAWCPGHAILVWDQVIEKFVSSEDGEWTLFQAWTPLPDPPTVGIYHDGESRKVLPK